MTLRNRVALIVAGTIVFVVVAPLLVLLARGYYFDFAKREFVQTGTLTAKTDPRGAAVFIDGENRGNTPFVARFVLPGDYTVELLKPGYFVWKKSIAIRAPLVTSLPPAADRAYLLKLDPETSRLATTTTALLPDDSAAAAAQYHISTSTDELLFESTVIARDLPQHAKAEVIASPDRQIFLLLDDALYQVSDELIKINAGVAYASWNVDARALLYGNGHEIWLWHPEANNQNELITRLSEPISRAIYNSRIGYFFYSSQNKVLALEYDPVLRPNLHTLAETKSAQVPLHINDDGTELRFLDSGYLVTLKIR